MSKQLSQHFHEDEFRCRCGCGMAIVSLRLIRSLEELRAACGGNPIRINSGYRCPRHNRAIRGAKRSKHLFGEAADIVVAGMEPGDVAKMAEQVEGFQMGGIGIYRGFVHVDVGTTHRPWRGDFR